LSKQTGNIHSLKDTRGLPPDYDPRYFYEYASSKRQRVATGLEGIIYKFIPASVIGSLAFALDPFQQFKTATGRVTAANRTRERLCSSILDTNRALVNDRLTYVDFYRFGSLPHQFVDAYFHDDHWQIDQSAQPALEDISKDTTKRTRVVGSDNGEFSDFRVTLLDSPSRSVFERFSQNILYLPGGDGSPYYYHEVNIHKGYTSGPAATISNFLYEQLRTNEWDRSLAEMQDKSLAMFKGILPSRRNYTLFRNIVELRDLPRGVLQLRETIRHLRQLALDLNIPKALLERINSFKISASDVPKEFLSYSFGWAQTYRDVRDLLLTPQRIGKKIDFLIRRNGQATTYRSQRKFSTRETLPSGFSYPGFSWETEPVLNSFLERESVLKMVVNANFEFPGVDLPSFRNQQWKRYLGVYPTPTDFYNLVPWTWLVDWFTGLGDYVEVIDTINSNNDLINWGLVTNKVVGNMVTNMVSQSSSTDITGVAGQGPGQEVKTTWSNSHKSVLQYSSTLRRDIGTLFNVRTTTDTSSLTTYQLAILGSLIATRSNFTR
jgi:hypothetical protein